MTAAVLRHALRGARAVAWDVDLDTKSVVWSENADVTLGLPAGAFGDSFLPEPDWIHPDDVAATLAALDRAAEGIADYDLEHRIVGGGEVRWVAARGSRIDAPDGTRHLAGVLIDITEVRAAREQLETMLRSRDEWLATVSHEIRNPLTTIFGMADHLLDDPDRYDEETIELLGTIRDQASELVRISEDLLVLGRGPAGDMPLALGGVEVQDAVEQGLAGWGAASLARIEVESRPMRALADPVRLRQIVRNLVANALRYGGPSIRIEIAAMHDDVFVRVFDDGPGVDDDEVEQIFQPYQTGSTSTAESTGLGLSVSRRLARAMGGDLTYRRRDGETVFELRLQKAQPPAVA